MKQYDNYKNSGVEWLGEIPEHWEVSRLGTLLNPISTNNRIDLPLLSITREKGVILRDLDNESKTLDDFTISGESESVKNDFDLKKLRIFTILEEKFYFENHIKNLSNGYRIHYFEKDDKIYIGYIGKHLPTKNFD